jgi:hypothetical protein
LRAGFPEKNHKEQSKLILLVIFNCNPNFPCYTNGYYGYQIRFCLPTLLLSFFVPGAVIRIHAKGDTLEHNQFTFSPKGSFQTGNSIRDALGT